MTWADAGLGLAAFVLTALEAGVSAAYTASVVARDVRRSVAWGVVFEALLLLDIWFLLESRWLAGPILVGSGVGIWLVVRRRNHI